MTTLPECTCPEDDWMGARGHINLTMNGHWPLRDSDEYMQCQQCSLIIDGKFIPRFVPKSYADGRKRAMNQDPLYTTPDEWWAALDAGTGHNLTPDQVKAAAKTERQRLKDQAKADAITLAANQARGQA